MSPARGCRNCWSTDQRLVELTALGWLCARCVDQRTTALSRPVCRGCGCTDDHACPGGCWWVDLDLCSQCAYLSKLVGDLDARDCLPSSRGTFDDDEFDDDTPDVELGDAVPEAHTGCPPPSGACVDNAVDLRGRREDTYL